MSANEKEENKTDNTTDKGVSKDDEIQKYNSFNYWKQDNYDQDDLPDLSSAEPIKVDEDDFNDDDDDDNNDNNNNNENGDERSPSTCSQSTYIKTLTNTLKQYDKDNDGYINWNEFCAMARDKKYTNYERDQLWIQLGAGKMPTKNSFIRKISIQPIIQPSHTKKKGKKKLVGNQSSKNNNKNYLMKMVPKYKPYHIDYNINYRSYKTIPDYNINHVNYQSYHTIPDYNINNINNINYQNAYKSMNTSNNYNYNNDNNNNYINNRFSFNNRNNQIPYRSRNQSSKNNNNNYQLPSYKPYDIDYNINNNNINNEVVKGGSGSYDTTFDRNNVCWEFNTFAGCRKGAKCTWEHKYLLKDAINPYTGEKLHGMAVRKFRSSNNI